jgi:hypothetical protein
MNAAWILTICLGGLFGIAELISRFRDEPFKVLKGTISAWGYILLNMGIAAAAFYFLTKTDLFGTAQADLLKAALTAGLGSSLLMRSKFLKATISGKEVAVGPEIIINVLLETLEKRIDRERALARKRLVEHCMSDIDFYKVKDYTVQTLIASSQICSAEMTNKLMNDADKIESAEMGEREKSYALGYLVLDMMGEKFLEELFTDT